MSLPPNMTADKLVREEFGIPEPDRSNDPRKTGICNNGHQMERRDGMFHWRGDTRPGWVCPVCNALWEIEGDEIEPLRPASPA
jgi:hypothetical protein